MHGFIKLFYGLLFISICSADSIDAGSLKNKTVASATNTTVNVSKHDTIAFEGGNLPSTDKTHSSREHVVDTSVHHDTSVSFPNILTNTANKTVDNMEEKPVNESLDSGISSKNDYKKIVPKKGAPVDNDKSTITDTSKEINVTSVTNSTDQLKLLPTKPTITEHGDESPIFNETKYNKSDVHTAKTNNFHNIRKEKSDGADYVIPIVAVILSVPLVAIIISVLYKRGTYWWQHRNYRRMDFLIEGMYNT